MFSKEYRGGYTLSSHTHLIKWHDDLRCPGENAERSMSLGVCAREDGSLQKGDIV